MKELFRQFRPFDYILIGIAILLSFAPAIATAYFYQVPDTPEARMVAIVRINGEIVDELPLIEGAKELKTYHPNPGQYNIVEINGTAIRVKEDNSPDQIAVNTGWINQRGQILVCLPHQLVIEIQQVGEDESNSEDEDIILPL